jgi:hypothetical protein
MRAPTINPQAGQPVADGEGKEHEPGGGGKDAQQLPGAGELLEEKHSRERRQPIGEAAQRKAVGQRDAKAIDAMNASFELEDDAERLDVHGAVVHGQPAI